MGMILIAYLSICICVCVFKRLTLLLLGAGFAYDWYAFFITHQFGRAILVLFLLCLTVTLYRVACGEDLSEKREKREKASSSRPGSNTSWNWINWILYVIPLFWPFLIMRLFFGGKTVKADMSPYDYEQHLKCNAR